MKIMFLIRSLNLGGAEKQLVILAKGLHARGHAVSVVVFYPDGPLQKEFTSTGITVHCLDKKGRWEILGFLVRLRRLFRIENPEILHGYLVVPNLLTIVLKALGCNARMVWGVRASYMDLTHYDWTARLTFKMSGVLARFADLIIVNSVSGRDFHMSRGYPAQKMVVVQNGIDVERFKPDKLKRNKVRQEFGVGEANVLIGMVARLDPMKNYEGFLEAATLYLKENDEARFICVGDGPSEYREKLHELGQSMEERGSLFWVGAKHEISNYYNALDIFCNCSYGEGFSNVVGEAMSCGVRCLVTDVGDSADIVGPFGVVVPPGKIDEIVKGWKALLWQKDHYGAEAIRGRIVKNFSVEKMIEHTENALSKIGM